MYAADFNNARIQNFDAQGHFLTQWSTEAPTGPTGLALDPAGHVYVLNHRRHAHYVQSFDTSGRLLLEWGGNGTAPGEFIGPATGGPDAIAVDGSGNVYVTDPGNSRLQRFDTEGSFLGAFGSIGQGQGQFISGPHGLAVDGNGNVYASDLTGAVQKFDGPSVRVLAKWEKTGATRLIALDNDGNILIRDDARRSIVKYRQS